MSFQTTITKVENNAVYQGFDKRSIKRCTPSVVGFRACAELVANGDGNVTLILTAESPLGNFSKTFSFNSNVDFEFNPIPAISIHVSVQKFRTGSDTISFELGLAACITLPLIGKKCIRVKFDIELPVLVASATNYEELSSGDIALLLLAARENECHCHS